jgi:hypothetical protein
LFVRGWGTSYDPEQYLDAVRERVDTTGISGIKAVAIRDDFAAARGLERQLAEVPARLLVVGADRAPARVVKSVLETVTAPVLVVSGNG